MSAIQELHPSLSYGIVLLQSCRVVLSFDRVLGSYRRLSVLPEDRAFALVKGSYLVRPFQLWDRSTMAVMASVTRTLAFVVSDILQLLVIQFGPRTWSWWTKHWCGYHPHTMSLLWPNLVDESGYDDYR